MLSFSLWDVNIHSLKEEELPHIPEEEVITQEKIQGDEKYICNRCNKEL